MANRENDTDEPGAGPSDSGPRGAGGRALREPNWRSAVAPGVAAAAVFVVFLSLVSKVPINEALPIAGLMLVFYVPIS